MDDFEKLLDAERISVERFVRFRLSSKADADDVPQEVYLTAYRKFSQLNSLSVLLERNAPGRDCQTAEYSCRNS